MQSVYSSDSQNRLEKIMYTTNTIESLNRQFRKFTKTKSVTDMSLLKCLYLATKDISQEMGLGI